MDRIQGLSVILSIFFFFLVLGFIKKQRFRERQAFLWIMLASAGVLTAACIPWLNRLAERVGVAYMPALVFVLAFFAVLTLLMLQAASVSAEQIKLKTLVQETAYLRLELEGLKDEVRAGRSGGAKANGEWEGFS
jgi:hypothetical protein